MEHLSVMLEEALQHLAIKPNGVYIDGTFGRGGHSRRILEALDETGRLLAFDRDSSAIASCTVFKHGNERGASWINGQSRRYFTRLRGIFAST